MTDTTDAIPEDVMEAARDAYRLLTMDRDWHGQAERISEIDRGEWNNGLVLRVAARAILAERERCAIIADMEEALFCDPRVRDSHYSKGARDASVRIADAIRKGVQP